MPSSRVRRTCSNLFELKIRRTRLSPEPTSDRANQACENVRNLDAQAKTAVHEVYLQLSELKEQLH